MSGLAIVDADLIGDERILRIDPQDRDRAATKQ
jgi:hypothetical protein